MSLSFKSVEKVNWEYNVSAYRVQKLSIRLQIPWFEHLNSKRLSARALIKDEVTRNHFSCHRFQCDSSRSIIMKRETWNNQELRDRTAWSWSRAYTLRRLHILLFASLRLMIRIFSHLDFFLNFYALQSDIHQHLNSYNFFAIHSQVVAMHLKSAVALPKEEMFRLTKTILLLLLSQHRRS